MQISVSILSTNAVLLLRTKGSQNNFQSDKHDSLKRKRVTSRAVF